MNWDTVLQEAIVQVAIPLVVGIILPLLVGYTRNYFSKNVQFAKIVQAAVVFAESSGLGMSGEEKLSLAVAFAQESLDAKGFGYIDLNYLIDAISGAVATSLNFEKMTSG